MRLLVQINETDNIKVVLREMGLIQLSHDRKKKHECLFSIFIKYTISRTDV